MKVFKSYISAKAHTKGEGLIVRLGDLYLAHVSPTTPIVVWTAKGIPRGSTTVGGITSPT